MEENKVSKTEELTYLTDKEKAALIFFKENKCNPGAKVDYLTKKFYSEEEIKKYHLFGKRAYFTNLFLDLAMELSYSDEEIIRLLDPTLSIEKSYYAMLLSFFALWEDENTLLSIHTKEIFASFVTQKFLHEELEREKEKLQKEHERAYQQLEQLSKKVNLMESEKKDLLDEMDALKELKENYEKINQSNQEELKNLRKSQSLVVHEKDAEEEFPDTFFTWIKMKQEKKKQKQLAMERKEKQQELLQKIYGNKEIKGKEDIDYLLLKLKEDGYSDMLDRLLTSQLTGNNLRMLYDEYQCAGTGRLKERWLLSIPLFEKSFEDDIFAFFKSIIRDEKKDMEVLFLFDPTLKESLEKVTSNYSFYERIQNNGR